MRHSTSPLRNVILTNNITISTRSHQQLIETLHNMQEIYKIIYWQDSKINNDDVLSQHLTKNVKIIYHWNKYGWIDITNAKNLTSSSSSSSLDFAPHELPLSYGSDLMTYWEISINPPKFRGNFNLKELMRQLYYLLLHLMKWLT